MKKFLCRRFAWLSALAIVVLCATVVLAALLDDDTKVEDLFSYDLYNSMMASHVKDVSEIVEDFEWQQYMYLPIAVPDPDFVHVQSGGILPFDTTRFPADFLKGLVPVQEAAITMYPITVYEDPNTRERVILNAKDEKIGGQYSPWSYDPQWFVKERYPSLSTMDSEYADWLIAMYNPSRIVITYKLILEDELIKYVWVQSIAAAQAEEEGGGMMKSSWSGSVTNLQFVEIYKTNDYMAVVLGYPDSYKTNSSTAFEIFTCDGGTGLIDFWWELGTVTNVDTSTNFVEWIDAESSNSYVDIRFYAAAVSNDVDGDGFTDGFEKYVYHTSVTNSNSYPCAVSGTISYTGSLTGPVRMIAVTESNSWVGCMETISSPGAYTSDKVANGTSYWFKAYRDCDYSKTREYGEPWGVYSSSSTLVTNNLTGINITITDRDEDDDGLIDWWEMQYFGDLDEAPSGDYDGDGLSNGDERTYGTDPTDTDSDDDGMGDGAEVDHGNSPSSSNIYATLPFFEDFQFFDVLHPASNAQNFGYSVAAHSNRILVGAYSITNGSAFVFHWDGTNWTQEAQLQPWASTTNDRFGFSVALSGDFAVVGAWGDGINGTDSGAAYVYSWDGTNWQNDTKLLPGDGMPEDRFGYSVAVSSNAIVVGAPYHNTPNVKSGAVYSYAWDGASWTNNTQKLLTTSSSVWEWFGQSVALSTSGDTLCIGESGYSWYYGRVNLFRWSGSNWVDRIIKTPLVPDDYSEFGASLSVSDSALIVGSPRYDRDSAGDNRGAAYLFQRQGTNWTAAAWTQTAMLCPGDLAKNDNFGHSVALIDGAAMVGTHKRAERAYENAGVLYLYEQADTNWSYTGTVARELVTSSSYLGHSVAAASGRFVSGAYGEGDSGTVFSFPTNALFACASSNSVLRAPQWASSTLHAGFLDHVCPTNSNIALGVSPLFALDKTVKLLVGGDQVSTIWIDFDAMIAPSHQFGYESTPDMPDLPPWQATYFTIDSSGHPVALNGASTWSVASNVTVNAGDFHRYTVRQDYGEDVWSLYVDGSNVLSDLTFVTEGPSEFSCYSFAGAFHAASYIDNVSISTNQPDFE